MTYVKVHSAAGPRRPDAPSPHEPIWPLLYPAKNDPDYVEVGYGGHFVRREIVERYEGVFVKRSPQKPTWVERQAAIRGELRARYEARNGGRPA